MYTYLSPGISHSFVDIKLSAFVSLLNKVVIFLVWAFFRVSLIITLYFCEGFEPRSHFTSRLSLIIRVNVIQNRTVVVDSD